MWTKVEFGDYAAAANFQERPLGDVVAEYVAVRAAFVAFLRGLDAAAWERRAPAPMPGRASSSSAENSVNSRCWVRDRIRISSTSSVSRTPQTATWPFPAALRPAWT